MADSAKKLSLARKLAYAAILTLLATAVLVGALEGGLRLAGVGHSSRFARTARLADGTEVIRENRWCTAPFFSAALVRRPPPMRLPAEKPPDAFRVFVLGSSAAMGDPDASFSLARVLEKLLVDAYPEVHVEVVNAGITAVNSHVVRGIAQDCARLQPDLFIIYEGNNEVIGPFGPAGVFTPFLRGEAAVRLAVALKSTRTGQLVSAAGRAFAQRGRTGAPEDWGGMEMFLDHRIAADDPRLDIVRAHFRRNLQAMIEAARGAGAATIVSTVAVNARTFAPFASLHRADLAAEALADWERLWSAGERAVAAGDPAAADAAYRAALAIDDRHAELRYRVGQVALRAGREAEARDHLQRAVDLDALRFRTDSSLNDVIRSLGLEGGDAAPGVHVVDAAAQLAAQSPHGLCGDEFLYEHVHLTLRGTYELARALLPAIQDELTRRGRVKDAATRPILSYDEIRVRLGFTAYEQGMIAAEMLSRFQRPPFTAQSDHGARLELWRRRSAAAESLLARPDALESLRGAMEHAMAAAPEDWVLARNAGMMLVARGAAADAVPLLERALGWIDDDVDTLAALVVARRSQGQADEAERLLRRLRELEPRHPGVTQSSSVR